MHKNLKHFEVKKQAKGFTMIELLIVLVIVGLLAALVGPALYKRIEPAKSSVAKAQIENFSSALNAYYIDTGDFPTEQQGLAALRVKPSGADNWQGPYLNKEIPLDPWGAAYLYRSPGRSGGFEIVSLGKDKTEGGDGDNQDIESWR